MQRDPRCYLYFANSSDKEFLSVLGTVEVVNDVQRNKDLWSPWAKAWVPDGPEDPDLRALKLRPQDAYYWDTKENKVVAMVKVAIAVLSGGKTGDGGMEGHGISEQDRSTQLRAVGQDRAKR